MQQVKSLRSPDISYFWQKSIFTHSLFFLIFRILNSLQWSWAKHLNPKTIISAQVSCWLFLCLVFILSPSKPTWLMKMALSGKLGHAHLSWSNVLMASYNNDSRIWGTYLGMPAEMILYSAYIVLASMTSCTDFQLENFVYYKNFIQNSFFSSKSNLDLSLAISFIAICVDQSRYKRTDIQISFIWVSYICIRNFRF